MLRRKPTTRQSKGFLSALTHEWQIHKERRTGSAGSTMVNNASLRLQVRNYKSLNVWTASVVSARFSNLTLCMFSREIGFSVGERMCSLSPWRAVHGCRIHFATVSYS